MGDGSDSVAADAGSKGSTAGADDGDDGSAEDVTNWSQASKRSGVDVRIADEPPADADGSGGDAPVDSSATGVAVGE